MNLGKPTYWRPVDWIVMIYSWTMFIKFKRKLIPVLFIVYFSNFNSRKKYICTVTKQIYWWKLICTTSDFYYMIFLFIIDIFFSSIALILIIISFGHSSCIGIDKRLLCVESCRVGWHIGSAQARWLSECLMDGIESISGSWHCDCVSHYVHCEEFIRHW